MPETLLSVLVDESLNVPPGTDGMTHGNCWSELSGEAAIVRQKMLLSISVGVELLALARVARADGQA